MKYCFYQLGSLEDAEDLAQRVFERAYSAWERFDPGQADPGPKVRSWLFTIAHNEIVNRHRARVRHQSDSLDIASTLPASGPTPEELAILADNHGRLYTAISALSPELKQVVELRLFGLNDTEIADFLNRTPGAIRTAQCRAVAQLRSLMVVAAEIKEGSNG